MKTKLVLPILLAATLASSAATFTVITTADSGPDSLRDAIGKANTNAGTDTITFSLPGPSYSIYLSSALPNITDPIIITGYGGSANENSLPDDDNATPNIELTTSNNIISAGLSISAGSSVVQGLVINGFSSCIFLAGKGGNIIAGNFLGLAPDGSNASPRPTGTGVQVATTNGVNLIGGSTPAARNLISGNVYGITVTSPLPGLAITYIEGNFIGTDRHGTQAIPNGLAISIASKGNHIGGPTVDQRNVISGNNGGVQITGPFNVVQGNFIGTDVTGRFALGNSSALSLGGGTNQVGGLTVTPGAPPGNLISGNTTTVPFSAGGTGNIIQGNMIGLDVTGTNRLANGNDGLRVSGDFALIGGTNVGAGNVISGNSGAGLHFSSSPGSYSVIQGNWIGTDVSGTLNLSNKTHGIWISGPRNCLVGGAAPNVIAFNGGSGIAVQTVGATNNLISANSIFRNAVLGIDLSEVNSLGNVTPNDPCGADTAGANRLQNFPVLTNVILGASSTTIEGYMPGEANAGYRLEFFANDSSNASGYGEGQTYLGSMNVPASANCTNAFSVALPVGSLAGKYITATATDANNNTSEFSASFTIASGPPPQLGINPSGDGQVTISWIPASPGFALQETLSLAPANWTNSPSGATNPITVSTTNGTRYYRLFQP